MSVNRKSPVTHGNESQGPKNTSQLYFITKRNLTQSLEGVRQWAY